jgi:hypothetical protein
VSPALCSFGLGILVGSPMGISAKLCILPGHAVDLAVGAALIGDGGPDIHVDYLWQPIVLAERESFSLAIYLGLGARVMQAETHQGDDLHVGARVPLGIAGELAAVRLDIFVETAVLFDFIETNHDAVDVDVGLGLRYYF